MDGFSCVTVLERLESVILFAEHLDMEDMVVNLGEEEQDLSDLLGEVLKREWACLAEWAAACEERQRSIAAVVSIFSEIQGRVEVLASKATILGNQAEDFAFTARIR